MEGNGLTQVQFDFIDTFIVDLKNLQAKQIGAETPQPADTTEEGRSEEERLRSQAEEARVLWIRAKDTVDEQIGRLQNALRDLEDPSSILLADEGLNGFTGGLQVKLIKTLFEARACPAGKADDLRSATLDVIGDYLDLVQSGEEIACIEDVAAVEEIAMPLNLRGELGGALKSMQKVLAT